MPESKQSLLQGLQLNHAYGQLVALIFIPILILAGVGAVLVLNETNNASRSQQRHVAIAILSRYQHTAELLLDAIQKEPKETKKAQTILMRMLNERFLQRVSLVDEKNNIHVNVGIQANKAWPHFNHKEMIFGPISNHNNTVYGIHLNSGHSNSEWLLIELDNQPMELAHYHVVVVLIVTGFITFILLILCLGFYSRRWIAPLYEIRMQLQRLDADNLDQTVSIDSSGELRLLQLDISNMLKRLHDSFLELQEHTEQTEDDLRRTLDTLEVQNITYRQARDQAISANQSKSVFLANISHELRTPLNSIDGFIHLMLRQHNLSNEQNLYLQTIRKSSAHLLALINDVLDFSKIDAGKLELETALFDLEEAMFDVMDMLSPLAAEKKINMAFYFADDIPHQVTGDILRFKQILTNLISNAIKFTPEGEIIVRARLEHASHQECVVHFSIQDSGIGISEHERKRLFESFSQGDASITRQFGGTGLGLAISKQLVTLMKGQIGFEDNQERAPTEKGSTFWFTVRFALNKYLDIPELDFQHMHVVSYMSHSATANVLRHYLENYQVQHTEATSLLDLFGQLNTLEQDENTWVIVDHGNDTHALLTEIRTRYFGKLAIYGYQMALEPNTLKEFKARPLYQPLSRQALIQLLTNQVNIDHEKNKIFNGEGLQVLAVDDHLPNLIVLEALLGEINVTTVKALSGQDAINLIQQRIDNTQPLFDLVFMDIQMPVMSGIDTTRAIRSLEATLEHQSHLPIIALTAHALSDEKKQLLAVGMDDYVTKPIQIEQLTQILTTWTDKNFETVQTATISTDISPNTDLVLLDWNQSVQLAANKEDLAFDLLQMLIDSFDGELDEMQQLIELEDFPQLEHVLHRLYGATRYVGTPKLQDIAGEFEIFMSTLRKEQRIADENFIKEVLNRFEKLSDTIEKTRVVALKKIQDDAM